MIADATRDWFANIDTVSSCSMTNGHPYVLAGDAASFTTEYEWTIVTTAGDTVTAHGSWTYVFKSFDGEWKVVHSAGTHLYD